MLAIPLTLQKKFDNYLKSKEIPVKFQGEYKKWLQYYLDFCRKDNFSQTNQESLPPFIRKLQEKRQTKAQQERASNSVNLYYQIVKAKATSNKTKELKPKSSKYVSSKVDRPFVKDVASPESVKYRKVGSRPSHDLVPLSKTRKSSSKVKPDVKKSEYSIASRSIKNKLKNTQQKGASWVKEYSMLEDEIRVRHYSPKTLKTYRSWVRKFQAFTKSKPPELLSADEVKEYLTFLAVKPLIRCCSFTGMYLKMNSERSTVL